MEDLDVREIDAEDMEKSTMDKFKEMPKRFKRYIKELKSKEYILNLNKGQLVLESITKKKTDSALKEKFDNAMKILEIRQSEIKNKKPVSKIEHKDEYYLFLRQFFLSIDVDWEHPVINFNSYPIIVDTSAKLVKVHYLFQMLGIGSLFVSKKGKLIGRLTMEKFLNLRNEEANTTFKKFKFDDLDNI